MYLTGASHFKTCGEAIKRFEALTQPAALEICTDGTAWITYVQSEPVQKGQSLFIGTSNTVYNAAARGVAK